MFLQNLNHVTKCSHSFNFKFLASTINVYATSYAEIVCRSVFINMNIPKLSSQDENMWQGCIGMIFSCVCYVRLTGNKSFISHSVNKNTTCIVNVFLINALYLTWRYHALFRNLIVNRASGTYLSNYFIFSIINA